MMEGAPEEQRPVRMAEEGVVDVDAVGAQMRIADGAPQRQSSVAPAAAAAQRPQGNAAILAIAGDADLRSIVSAPRPPGRPAITQRTRPGSNSDYPRPCGYRDCLAKVGSKKKGSQGLCGGRHMLNSRQAAKAHDDAHVAALTKRSANIAALARVRP